MPKKFKKPLIFAVSLLISITALLVVAVWTLPLFRANAPMVAAPAANIPVEPALQKVWPPGEQDCLTVLFIGQDKNDNSAETFLLARFDPVRGRVPAVCLPVHTAVHQDNLPVALSQLFRRAGERAVADALETLLGITIDRTVLIAMSGLDRIATVTGRVTFALESGISGDLSRGIADLPGGVNMLDAAKIRRIISCQDYEGGELQRCNITAKLFCAAVNQKLPMVLDSRLDKLYSRVMEASSTDIVAADFTSRLACARFMAQLRESPAVAVSVEGTEYSGHFIPEEECIKRIKELFTAS